MSRAQVDSLCTTEARRGLWMHAIILRYVHGLSKQDTFQCVMD